MTSSSSSISASDPETEPEHEMNGQSVAATLRASSASTDLYEASVPLRNRNSEHGGVELPPVGVGPATPGSRHVDDESLSVDVGPAIPDSTEKWLTGAGGLLMLALNPRCSCSMFPSFACRLP